MYQKNTSILQQSRHRLPEKYEYITTIKTPPTRKIRVYYDNQDTAYQKNTSILQQSVHRLSEKYEYITTIKTPPTRKYNNNQYTAYHTWRWRSLAHKTSNSYEKQQVIRMGLWACNV